MKISPNDVRDWIDIGQTVAPHVRSVARGLGQMVPLPSQTSAQDLVDGKTGALPRAAFHLLGRASLVGLGIYVFAGERDLKKVVTQSLAGAAMIEIFVLGWCTFHKSGSTS